METLHSMALGFQVSLQPANLFLCFVGVFVGTLIGVLPGIGPVGTMSLLLPATLLDYAPDTISLDKAGYDIEHSVTVLVVGPKGMPAAVIDRLEKAFTEAMKAEPFVSVARKNELIAGERLSGQALADHLRKVSANYEGLIKEAGVYKSEKK